MKIHGIVMLLSVSAPTMAFAQASEPVAPNAAAQPAPAAATMPHPRAFRRAGSYRAVVIDPADMARNEDHAVATQPSPAHAPQSGE